MFRMRRNIQDSARAALRLKRRRSWEKPTPPLPECGRARRSFTADDGKVYNGFRSEDDPLTLTQHIAVTAVAAAAIAPFVSGEGILLFAAGGILIDVDHYLLYIQRTRRFDVRGMFRYFAALQPIQKTIPYVGLCLFHTVDFFFIVGILALYHPFLLPLLAGFLFHFAHHRVFETFAWLDETGDRGVAIPGPGSLAA